ncbi:YqaE/Pmp3 family membrane protein [Halomonas sp. I1]|uniref:YqaE/Pmp3 family membrane protein n=1 Tax=Halomonas sp. I1 TaxID=393536 RepID=UPI0028DE0AB5|nr:YqaE/Pmp3 family membrane protein [Halomonas sp. I1]MDT8895936.1 YqaE/Pmp3 family membrane protein [Halomonas sp. I1]
MDAREYLARKGLDGERDKERPNTLEEKAWYRARESGDHRPKAGTPHDWEDWERYHETLAEGADALEQKIDHEAHQRALDHEQPSEGREVGEGARSGSGVEHFTPPASAPEKTVPTAAHEAESRRSASGATRPEPFAAMVILAVLMPPLAMVLAGAGGRRVLLSLVLMLLGWIPGSVYAVFWLLKHY